MSDAVQLALIATVPPTLLAAAALISSIRNSRKVEALHVAVNSRLTQLLEQKGLASVAEGMEAGRREGKIETAAVASAAAAALEKGKPPVGNPTGTARE